MLKRTLLAITAIGLLVGLGYASSNARAIADWWILRDYQPTQEVASITENIALTDKARKIFYVYDPQIEDSSEFNQHCTVAEVSIVLGCYNGSKIYIFHVDDEKLQGVKEVTAAHEMLHAAYDRLDDKERSRIDQLTQRQFLKLNDERIRNTVQSYRNRDPSVVPNELHSILATEVRNLDAELEEYYRQYFTDRSKVVQLSENYEQVFTDIKNRVERLDAELTLLKAQIDSLEASLSQKASAITAEKSEMDILLERGKVSEYNSRVSAYNASIESYNRERQTYTNLIADYNAKVVVRNQTTIEQNNLVDSLSSKATELQ